MTARDAAYQWQWEKIKGEWRKVPRLGPEVAKSVDAAAPPEVSAPASTRRCNVCQLELPLGKFRVDTNSGRECRRNRCKRCDDAADAADQLVAAEAMHVDREEAIVRLARAIKWWSTTEAGPDREGAIAAVMLRARQLIGGEP